MFNNRFDYPRLQCDTRLGGYPKWLMSRSEDWKMQVPDEIRQCVAFIGVHRSSGFSWAGTCFFVAIPCEARPSLRALYLVTSRHSLEDARRNWSSLFIRLNIKNGNTHEIETKVEDWITHNSDSSIDVAVYPVDWKQEFDHLAYPAESFISSAVIQGHAIGPGDDVFLAGLFKHARGEKRNIPIVRTGTIAAMPDEPIHLTNRPDMRGHLIELHSVGGLSGSPVFAHIGPGRDCEIGGRVVGYEFFLMGMIHGHYDSEADQRRNAGIAIVVPVASIAAVLNDDRLVAHRKTIVAEDPRVTSTTDSVIYRLDG